ncbi:MAG: M23 family metallopeptidase [Blastomonas sp.]
MPFGKVRPLASGIVFDEPPIQGGVIRGIAPDGVTSLSLDGEPVDIMPDRAFIIAFNRDAPRRAVLSVGRADGSQAEETLDVSPREWRIERVNVAMRGSTPSEAYMALRRPELEQIGLARAIRSDSQGWRQQFIWPVKGRISGLFGSQRVYRGEPGSFHSGVDVSTGTSGTPIVAPADGVVILAADKPFTLEGNLLMLDHGMGLNSAFLHLSEISVKPGEAVRQGQVIGRIGATGRATGPHLHWSMKWRDARIDPLLLAGPMD